MTMQPFREQPRNIARDVSRSTAWLLPLYFLPLLWTAFVWHPRPMARVASLQNAATTRIEVVEAFARNESLSEGDRFDIAQYFNLRYSPAPGDVDGGSPPHYVAE